MDKAEETYDPQDFEDTRSMDDELSVERLTMAMLPFLGFDPSPAQFKRRMEWEEIAMKVIDDLAIGNTSLVADTGAGKTIIALLAIIARGWRTLFLTPQRYLACQHQRLLDKITAESVRSRVITGLVRKARREWHAEDRIVFATPHIALNDWRRGMLDLGRFDLIVEDEFHKATGAYPYVPLAEEARKRGLKILSLSASPGGSLDKIVAVTDNCDIKEWVRAEIQTPAKYEHIEPAQPDKTLKEIEQLFKDLLKDAALDLVSCGIELSENEIVPIKELLGLRKKIDSIQDKGRRCFAMSAHARYIKLRFALTLAVTENYDAFMEYAIGLKDDGTRAAERILKMHKFLQIYAMAKANRATHPKLVSLVSTMQALKERNRNAIVFISNKSSARGLHRHLLAAGIRVDVVFGGTDKDLAHQEEVLDKLAQREIDCVIGTSVIEEGVSIAEVDTVIHYSMPVTEISRMQRSGRTGRIRGGEVIYLAIDHPMDMLMYYVTRSGQRRMRKIVKEGLQSPLIRKKLARHRNRINQQAFAFMKDED